jgi:N-acetyltransferase
MNAALEPVTLQDDVVTLAPLSRDHVPGLWRAASKRSTYGLTRVPRSEEDAAAYVDLALSEQARGVSLPFAILDSPSGRILGSTRLMTIERWEWRLPDGAPPPRLHPDAVEIGSTWLTESAQRTAINTHAKLLLLGYAFDAWGVRRVTLKTDARNRRSRAAIERLGARFDGVLRAHSWAFDGAIRDTAFYSILLSEWPGVRAALTARASREAHGARPASVGVRPSLPEEDTILADHFVRMWRDIGVEPGGFRDDASARTIAFVEAARRDLAHRAFVAEVPGQGVVGSASCQIFAGPYPDVLTPAQRRYGYLWGVYVEPAWRRKGVATALTRSACAYLASIGCTHVVLHASKGGRPVYAALGFEDATEMRLALAAAP